MEDEQATPNRGSVDGMIGIARERTLLNLTFARRSATVRLDVPLASGIVTGGVLRVIIIGSGSPAYRFVGRDAGAVRIVLVFNSRRWALNDRETSVAALREEIGVFVKERDWEQFHNPKNLSMAIAIEAAELMEHFQWLETGPSREVRLSPNDLQQVREELADILAFTLSFANALDIDLTTAFREKMIKNAKKYPAAEFQGKFRR